MHIAVLPVPLEGGVVDLDIETETVKDTALRLMTAAAGAYLAAVAVAVASDVVAGGTMVQRVVRL